MHYISSLTLYSVLGRCPALHAKDRHSHNANFAVEDQIEA